MSLYNGKKVFVSGGTGMIGSHLIEALVKEGAIVRTIAHRRGLENLTNVSKRIDIIKGDLTKPDDCAKAVKGVDFVFQLAADVGGISYNISHPASLFRNNVSIQTQLLEASRLENIDRYLFTSSACVYPAKCKIPISEEECIIGEFTKPPEPTNSAYGWAKRLGELLSQYYKKEYGMKIAIVRPFNAYGPRDTFDLEKGHVIPSLIKKATERQYPFRVWGNGKPSRDFVYVTDIVKGMLLALEKYPKADPINIATGKDITIRDLVMLILKLTGYDKADIIFEKVELRGQMIRRGDGKKAKKLLGFETAVTLEEGLKNTIEWFKKKYKNI